MENIALLSALMLGILLKAVSYLKSKNDLLLLAALIVASLGLGILLEISESSRSPDPDNPVGKRIIISTVVFSLGFTYLFQSQLLRKISARALLGYTLILFYTAWVQLPVSDDGFHPALQMLAFAVTITLGIALIPLPPNPAVKFGMYVWFLLVDIAFMYQQYSFGVIKIIFNEPANVENLIFATLTGMVFLQLLINLVFLALAIPFVHRVENQWEVQKLREHIDTLIAKVDESPGDSWNTLCFASGLGMALYLNARNEWLQPWIVMNGAIIAIGYVDQIPWKRIFPKGKTKT